LPKSRPVARRVVKQPNLKTHAVPRLWPGETVVCIASGPSLTQADVDFVRGKARVIVVNTSYKMALWADVMYACDARLWKWHRGAPEFQGMKFALTSESARWPGVHVLGKSGTDGLSTDPKSIRTGSNSGYQAINVAVLMGAAKIVLLGYDMQLGPKGRQYWHADHPMKQISPYAQFRRNFETLVKPLQDLGIEVINCSRDSALKCFPKRRLEDVFAPVQEAVAC
jgi:hypothetical protein